MNNSRDTKVSQFGESLNSPDTSECVIRPAFTILEQLKQAMARSVFAELLHRAVFGELSGTVAIDDLTRTLLDLPHDTSSDNRPVALRFLVSLRKAGEAAALAGQMVIEDSAGDAELIKSIFRLGEIAGADGWSDLARDWCDGFARISGDDTYPDSFARVRSLEVLARSLRERNAETAAFVRACVLPPTEVVSPDPTSPTHLFVGLFGQMRFPDVILPELRAYLESQFAFVRERGGRVSFGAATWSNSGERRLGLHDDVEYLFARMPLDLANAIRPLRAGYLIRDLQTILPRTIDVVLGKQAPSSEINAELLNNLFGQEINVNIASDQEFVNGSGAFMGKWCAYETNHMNQARMWNRLGALKKILRKVEQAHGTVTHAFLIRPDLRISSGSVAELFQSGTRFKRNWIIVDHDSHAEFLEGLGDRFMLGDRAAIDRILDGERLMLSVLSQPDNVDPAYSVRLAPHRFLATVLFEHATSVSSVGPEKLNIEIFRGRMSIGEVADALRADVEASDNVDLRNAVSPFL